ncbi:MAG: FAD-dependent oxidoreductase [Elusimicrobiota bacterium]
MSDHRIKSHPILAVAEGEKVTFTWRGDRLSAKNGEMLSTALFANGIRIFGHHHKDGSPQGIFCANGQCSQCMVLADDLPVKSCMFPVREGLRVEPAEGNPVLPEMKAPNGFHATRKLEVECLIIGAGPAGLSAAVELGKTGAGVLLVDDKDRLGGKLVLQTHKFFGSIDACYAGTRGIDIATLLEKQVAAHPSVERWLNTTAIAVFSDGKVGLLRGGTEYVLVAPRTLLVAAGAREKSLAFKGNTLPGVYGAGAFQTLVNRDLVRPAEKLFIVGGGNVGLIAGYHALQAGLAVVGLIEALPRCGGYKVHEDKLLRFGVPIHTSHTVLSANGEDSVESVTIAKIDDQWRPVPGTERSFACDTILVAVGLDPVDEFYRKAVKFGLKAYSAGDAHEIAEASAAMFSGKIKGLEIARALGRSATEILADWVETEKILKSKPGPVAEELLPQKTEGVRPIFHCRQEIPCNPCTSVCPEHLIEMEGDLRRTPLFARGKSEKGCSGCCQCVTICPGLAITLVDSKKDPEHPVVTLAHEFPKDRIEKGDRVKVLDIDGKDLGEVEVLKVIAAKKLNRTLLVKLLAPKDIAARIAGLRVQGQEVSVPMEAYVNRLTDDTVICRCERVLAGDIRKLIKDGVRDMNEIKTITRAGMGACGAKTCASLIKFLFRQEGVPLDEVTLDVGRPMFIEVPMGVLAGAKIEEG